MQRRATNPSRRRLGSGLRDFRKYDPGFTLTHLADGLREDWLDRIRRNRRGDLEVLLPDDSHWRPVTWNVRWWIAAWFQSERDEAVTAREVGRAMEAAFPIEWTGRDDLRSWTRENAGSLKVWGRVLPGDVLAIRAPHLREALGRLKVSQIIDEAECDEWLVHNARRRDYQVWVKDEETGEGQNVRFLAFKGAADLLDMTLPPQ